MVNRIVNVPSVVNTSVMANQQAVENQVRATGAAGNYEAQAALQRERLRDERRKTAEQFAQKPKATGILSALTHKDRPRQGERKPDRSPPWRINKKKDGEGGAKR